LGLKAVAIVGLEPEKLSSAANLLREHHPGCKIYAQACDVANSDAVEAMATATLNAIGTPDILINNAGYAHYLRFHEMTLSEVVRHTDVNLIGAMRVTHVFLPALRKAKQGQIVNVASIAGHFLVVPNLAYATAKHGMVAWSAGLGLELAADNILVQVISPGRVETGFFDHESFQKRAVGREMAITLPMDRLIGRALEATVRRRLLTIIPWYWGVFAWALNACPWVLRPLYNFQLRQRLERLDKGFEK
jgi:short-subunit dehydrogenase